MHNIMITNLGHVQQPASLCDKGRSTSLNDELLICTKHGGLIITITMHAVKVTEK
jgi:hypothetical protein